MRRAAFFIAVGVVITINLLPAFDIHIVPESIRRAFHFRYNIDYVTEFETWKGLKDGKPNSKEIGLALKERFTPEDTIILGTIGARGYYSEMSVYDAHGLVDREVARSPRNSELSSPGHDVLVLRDFFYPDDPTITHFQKIEGPPPTRKNPEYPLSRRIKETADIWREDGPHWKRYVPEALPLPPSPDGSHNALLVWRLIEEDPNIKTLPRKERETLRRNRARKEWDAFYVSLESW